MNLSHTTAIDIVQRVLSVPGVSSMHRGSFGEVALLFPGERVPGLRLADGRLEVHVVVKRSAGDLYQVAESVRGAVGGSMPIDVVIGDIE